MTLAEFDDEHGEARYVASEIEPPLERGGGPAGEQIAVFYRVNAQSRVLEDTLVRFEIPYQVIGGTKFYERAEIKDAIAYLSLLANPADAVSFARIVNSPRRGIGETTQARLLSHANTTGQDISEVFSEAERAPGLGAVGDPGRRPVRGADARPARACRGRAPGGRGRAAPGGAHRERIPGGARALSERSRRRDGLENLEELISVAGEFDANRELEGDSEIAPLEEFLAQISLYTDQDSLRPTESLCTLMTLHNAKGLEYDAVFMIGCEEGVFPHMRSLEEGNLEEERRLCYVGVTRAKRAAVHELRAAAKPAWGPRIQPALPVRRRDPGGAGRALRVHLRHRVVVPGAGRARRPRSPERRQPHASPLEFEVGDDVVHASFGEGVVTGVEPGNVLVVRFAGEADERKLMADYAPLRKAG